MKHLKKSTIGLGTAAIGRPLYINIKKKPTLENSIFNLDNFKQEGLQFLQTALQIGITHFDTSPGYGMAEDLLLEFLENNSTPISISTKWGYTYVANFNNNASVHEVKEHSLSKLNEQWNKSKQFLPHLNLYQIHSVTTESDVLENQAVINRLHQIKKDFNLEIGLSTSGENQIDIIKKALDLKVNNEALFTCFQVTFNVLDQSLLSIADLIKNKKIIIKEALANGRIISEKFTNYNQMQSQINTLAQKYKVTNDAIALRFCMDSFKGSIVLSGANCADDLIQNLKANDFELTQGELEILHTFAIEPNTYWEERKKLNWN